MFLWDGEIKGLPALHHIAKALFAANGSRQGYRLTHASSYVTAPPEEFAGESVFDLMKPNGVTKAIFFTGKGGVGKTTVSCAAAMALAQEGYRTLLLTTDPASHIGEVLEQRIEDTIQPVAGVEKLWAVIIDQEKAVLEYCTNEYFARRRLMQAKYLREINERFALPIAVMPLLEAEIRGIPMIRRAADELFTKQSEGAIR
jgi:arsenite/tail-anchored protein-transporting ATPase